MSDQTFYVATDAQGNEFVLFGDPSKAMWRGSFDVIVSRGVLDTQNLMLWRPVVARLTGEWPVCDVAVCSHENRRHQGRCRTFIGVEGGGPGAA